MAKGIKTGGKNFEKGHAPYITAKPLGPEIKRIRIEGKEIVATFFWDILNMDIVAMEARLDYRQKNGDVIPGKVLPTLFEETILRAMVKDMKDGRIVTVKELLERTLGKAKEYIQLGGTVNVERTFDLSKLTLEEKKALHSAMLKSKVSPNDVA